MLTALAGLIPVTQRCRTRSSNREQVVTGSFLFVRVYYHHVPRPGFNPYDRERYPCYRGRRCRGDTGNADVAITGPGQPDRCSSGRGYIEVRAGYGDRDSTRVNRTCRVDCSYRGGRAVPCHREQVQSRSFLSIRVDYHHVPRPGYGSSRYRPAQRG